jgi:hypothetical protein
MGCSFQNPKNSARNVVRRTFTVKMRSRRETSFVRIGWGQLAKTGRTQTAVASKVSPALAEDWLGGQGGQFIFAVRFSKSTAIDPQPAKMIKTLVESAFIGDAQNDEMRMREVSREKRATRFDGGMTGLDNQVS